MTEECAVCGEEVDTDKNFEKFDGDSPVYGDDYVYHLKCEDNVLEDVFIES